MDKKSIYIVNGFLAEGIDKGYRAGIAYIVKNLKDRVKKSFAGKPRRERNVIFSTSYTKRDLEAIMNFKLEAFTVAGVGVWEMEEKIKDAGVRVMEGELDREEFEFEVRRIMMQYGIGLGDQPPRGWLETNLNTAISSSVNGARWIRMTEPEISDIYPALEYKTQGDGLVREEHMELDGLVLAKDDPAWSSIYPPNGWNCRCYTVPISVSELPGYVVRGTDEDSRRELDKNVDKDFRRNSGKTESIWGKWINGKLKEMPGGERDKLERMVKDYGAQLKSQ